MSSIKIKLLLSLFKSLVNILSYGQLGDTYRITSDTWNEDAFTVHDFGGRDIKFVRSEEGLYYYNVRWKKTGIPSHILARIKRTNTSPKPVGTTLVVTTKPCKIILNTIRGNQEGFTKKQLQKAKIAKRIYIMLGRPSYRDFANIIKWKLLQNCPVEYEDVVNAWKIYGQDIGAIRGKATRKKPQVIEVEGILKIPQEILYQIQDVTLCADVMFCDKLVMLTTVLRRIGFTTIDILKNQSITTIHKALQKVFAVYSHREVPIRNLLTDRQFLPLDEVLLREDNVKLNTTSANEHVGDVERNVRVIKERVRAVKATLPYTVLPKLMKIALLKLTAFWLNLFPRKGQIKALFGPRMLLLGEMTDYNKICKVPFGAYTTVKL